MNWLKASWKWIVGTIVALGLWIGSFCLLWSSLFGANEKTQEAVKDVGTKVVSTSNDTKTAITTAITDSGNSTKAEIARIGGEITTAINGLKPDLRSTAPTPAPTALFTPAAETSELLVDLGDSDRNVAAEAAAQVVMLGRQGDDETLEGLALAYNSRDSRMKARVKWCFDQIGEPGKIWIRNTLTDHGTAPRLRVAIERLTSFESSNEAQIAQLQSQQSQAQKKLADAQNAWTNARVEDRQYLSDEMAKLRTEVAAENAKLKTAIQAAQRAAQSRPQPQPAPRPSPAATSTTMPSAAPPRVVYSTPYSYYGVTRSYGCR